MYHEGIGVAISETESVRWHQKAADCGDLDSAMMVDPGKIFSFTQSSTGGGLCIQGFHQGTLEGKKSIVRHFKGALTIPGAICIDGEKKAVTEIGKGAFVRCDNLTSLRLPDRLICIGDSAFEYCGIQTLELPDSIQTVDDAAFRCCERLTSVKLPLSLRRIGEVAFVSCNLSELNIPDSVDFIGERAFFLNRNLKAVTLSRRTTVGKNAFNLDAEGFFARKPRITYRRGNKQHASDWFNLLSCLLCQDYQMVYWSFPDVIFISDFYSILPNNLQ